MAVERFREFGVGRGEIFFLAAAVAGGVVALRGVEFRETRDLRNRLVFAAAHDAGSGAFEFDQRLARGVVFFVEMDGGLKFLVRLFRK